jgi:hypothetical protein
MKRIISSLIICSYCKLFHLPAILWSAEVKAITDILLELILLLSLAQCIRVVSRNVLNLAKSALIVMIAKGIHMIVMIYVATISPY